MFISERLASNRRHFMTGIDAVCGRTLKRCVTSEALSKAFTTALLLTGSVERSEAAVLESIGCLDFDDDASGEKLTREALKTAISRERQIAEKRPEDLDCALSFLPLELMRVLRLPADLRRCFALRVLAGLPRRFCALLLNLEIEQVEEKAGIAAQMLAGISEKEEQITFAHQFH
jgi:hypothetical protein